MRSRISFFVVVAAVVGLTVCGVGDGVWAQETEEAAAKAPTAEDIMKQAHLGLYYSGDDGRAVVNMELKDKKGKTRTRQFCRSHPEAVP